MKQVNFFYENIIHCKDKGKQKFVEEIFPKKAKLKFGIFFILK